jgi:hypothetical protein
VVGDVVGVVVGEVVGDVVGEVVGDVVGEGVCAVTICKLTIARKTLDIHFISSTLW